ncbi:MAG: hypothetical protein ABW223_07840 [Rariglobus sp.]
MNTRTFSVLALTLALAASPAALLAQKKHDNAAPQPPPPEPPVPIHEAGARPQPAPVDGGKANASGQQLYGSADSLVTPDKAKQVVDAFRATVAKDKPRYLIYVNRELVDETSGIRVTGRKERTESIIGEGKSSFEVDPNAPKSAAPAGGNSETQVNVNIGNSSTGESRAPGKGWAEGKGTKVTAENTYTYSPKTNGTLVDKQTVRDIERLFGRPLRAGGAKLADQKVGASLIADRPLDHFTTATNEAARKDREALAKVADVVVEILVSSRSVRATNISGDSFQSVPDIQATAIRLSDSAIIGQASATDVIGKDKVAGRVARKFEVSDIAEATALALMEDITLTTE